MFYVVVTGYWGRCYVGKGDDPVFSEKNARLFKTRQIACNYILKHWKEWDNVVDGSSTMTVKEV